jgi:DNA modification methylase
MYVRIMHGDVVENLKKLTPASVNLCITSPPYWALRDYGIEGQLGNEPTMEAYIDGLVRWVREVYRVLHSSGSFVLNLGDNFCGSGLAGTCPDPMFPRKHENQTAAFQFPTGKKYTPSNFLSVTSYAYCRIMEETNFLCRGEHIWCLEKNTPIVIRRAGRTIVTTIKDAHENGAQEILTPNQEGEIEWTPIRGTYKVGEKKCLKITLTNGLSVTCSEDHMFPVKGCQLHKDAPPYLQLHNKKAKDIRKGHYLMVSKKFPNPHAHDDEEDGFAIGFYLAEGNTYLDKRKGNTATNVTFACHSSKDRPHIKRLKRRFAIREYIYKEPNSCLRSTDRNLIALIRRYTEGRTSHDKHLKQSAFSTSTAFMHGIVTGFCVGDGWWRAHDRFPSFRIGITNNMKLMEDLIVLCRFIGWDFRFQCKLNVKLNGKEYPSIRFAIFPERKRKRFGDLECHKVRSIRNVGAHMCYELEMPSKYPDYRSGKAWNNLFCLANGIVTHNCKPNLPSPIRNRLKMSHEKLFWFVKDIDKYHFDPTPWMHKLADDSKAGQKRLVKMPGSSYQKGETPVKVERTIPNEDTIEHSWRIIPAGQKMGGFETADAVQEHVAPFPENLIEPYIQSMCPPNGTVLEPFLGSGTTMRLSIINKRSCIGIELNPKYVAMAKKRINWDTMMGIERIEDK